MPTRLLQSAIATLLLLMGGGVILDAALGAGFLGDAAPALARTGLGTAAALAGGGLALLSDSPQLWARRGRLALGLAIALTGVVTLLALWFQDSEQALWSAVYRNLPWGDRLAAWPGRITFLAACGLACGGSALAALNFRGQRIGARLVIGLIALTALAGAAGALICLSGIAQVFRLSPQIAVMRWPVGVALFAFAIALSLAAARHTQLKAYFEQREDRQVFLLAAAILSLVLLGAWSSGAGMLVREWIEHAERRLLDTARAQAILLDQTISHLAQEERDLLELSGVSGSMTNARDGRERTRLALARLLDQAPHAGLRGLSVRDATGERIAEAGLIVSSREDSIELAYPPAARLFADGGLVLRTRIVLGKTGVAPSQAIIDASLQNETLLASLPQPGVPAARLAICAAGPTPARCLPSTGGASFTRPAQLMPQAETAVTAVQDLAEGEASLLALARMPRAGADVLLELPASVVLVPLRARLAWTFLALFLLAMGGALLLRYRVRSLLGKLVGTRAELAAVIAHVPDGILTADGQGRVIAANPAACVMFGYSSDTLTGRELDALLVPPEHGEADITPGELQHWRAIRSSGQAFAAEVASASFTLDGQARRICIVRDISSRVSERMALQRHANIVQHAGWGICIGSADTRTLELVNPAFAQMHGYTVEELTGMPILTVLALEDHERFAAIARRVHELGHLQAETLHRRKDGSVFPVLANATAVRDAAGRVLYRVVSVQDISDIKRAESALRQSERLMRRVLEALPVGVWITDQHGRIVHGNTAGQLVWGGARPIDSGKYAEYRGWRPHTGDRLLPGDWALTRALTRGETSIGEIIDIEAFDGSFKTIRNSAIPLRDETGRIEGAIVVDEDISAQTRSAEELRINKELFQMSFDSAAVGMLLCDAEGRILLVNRALCAYLGESEAALLGANLHVLLDASGLLPAEGIATAPGARQQLQPVRQERVLRHRQGHTLWALITVAAVTQRDGAARCLIVQVVDITARKAAEDQLLRSEENLAQAQRMAKLGDWRWDIASDAMSWSATIFGLLELEPSDAPPSRQAFISAMFPEDAEALGQALLNAAGGLGALAIDCRCRKGHRVLHIQGERLDDADGNPLRLVGTLQDITERKRTEEALRESHEQLRALSAHLETAREEERKHLALEVHDELGQLLTALRMHVSLLRLGHAESDEASARLEEMRALLDHTLSVVRQVVTNLRPAALDFGLVPALEWLTETFEQNAAFVCNLECDVGDVPLSDQQATALFRIAQEALTNAARHAEASRVDIRLTRDGPSLTLQISDNGRGFDLDQALRGESFGLIGMHERARMLGSELHIDTSPGAGTMITVTLSHPTPCP